MFPLVVDLLLIDSLPCDTLWIQFYRNCVSYDCEVTICNDISKLETHMLLHHRPGISSQQSVVDVVDCHILVDSQNIVEGHISPNIKVATPN